MCERRILIVGSTESQTTDALFGLLALLVPFEWQHIFIPILPNHLMDYIGAPAPYLIGILESQLAAAMSMPLGDVVIVKLNERRVTVPGGGTKIIPYGLAVTPVQDAVLAQEKASAEFSKEVIELHHRLRKSRENDEGNLEAQVKVSWLAFALFVFGDISKHFRRLGSGAGGEGGDGASGDVVATGVDHFIAGVYDPDIRSFLKVCLIPLNLYLCNVNNVCNLCSWA
jgi:hypothetical protein